MAVVKLTLPFLKTIPSPKQRTTFWDSSLPCFGVRVSPNNVKTFVIKYRNQHNQVRWYTIGNFPTITLEQAREEARRKLADISFNKDPAKQKQEDRTAITVSELCDWYLNMGTSHKKQSTITIDRGRIETHIKPLLGKEPVASLTTGQITTFMKDVIQGTKIRRITKSNKPRGVSRVTGGQTAAARSVQLLGAIMEFAIQNEIITRNPVRGVAMPKSKRRDVFLTIDEIYQLGRILERPEWRDLHPSYCNIIKLILLTGCRRQEITNLRWEYIDFEHQAFRFPDTKTGQQTRVFGIGALHLLQHIKRTNASDWVFPSVYNTSHITNPLKPLKRMLKTTDDSGKLILEKPNLTIHALRHTFASQGADMGYSDILIGALLGHHSGTVTGRYTHTVDKTLVHIADTISYKIGNALNGIKEQPKIININKVA